MQEIWKDIEGYEGLYQVSSLGSIRNKKMNLKQSYDRNKYRVITLCKNGIQKKYRVNRIVAIAFIPNNYNKAQVNHIDGNKENNCVNNLEWVTNKENMDHALKTGLISHSSKKITQLNDEGLEINRYNSIYEAAALTRIAQPNITRACKSKSKAGGYVWRCID